MNNIKEITEKLVGSITPTGESHLDTKRLENLKVMCGLIGDLIYDIRFVARDKNRYESSMKVMGEYADGFLKGLKEEL